MYGRPTLYNLQISDNQLTEKDMVGKKTVLAEITLSVLLHGLIRKGLDISLPVRMHTRYRKLEQLPVRRQWVLSNLCSLKAESMY